MINLDAFRDKRIRIYTPLSLLRHIIVCVSADSSPAMVGAAESALAAAESAPAVDESRRDVRACVQRLMGDNAFVWGAVRRPAQWMKADVASPQAPLLARLR